MLHHDLKVWKEFFGPIFERKKMFEIRLNDRGFQVGDTLVLREVDPAVMIEGKPIFTGRAVRRRVIYMTDFPDGLKPGYVVLGLKILPDIHVNP